MGRYEAAAGVADEPMPRPKSAKERAAELDFVATIFGQPTAPLDEGKTRHVESGEV